jgi:hypothetical protein
MKAAQEMGRKRWEGASEAEKAEHGRMMAEARQKATTPEQRRASATKAAQARWGRKKKKNGKR